MLAPANGSAILPTSSRRIHVWTREEAAEMGRRSALLRSQRAGRPPPQPATQPSTSLSSLPPVSPQYVPDLAADYRRRQTARVRGHIRRLDSLLDAAMDAGDAQAIERLARARAALEEQERRSADRPLPAVLRSDKRSPGRASALLESGE